MKILWNKKFIRLSDGSYVAWGLKRKKFFFASKNELKLNCTIIEYYEQRERCDKKVISDLNKIIAELKERVKTLTIHDTNAVLSGLEMEVLKDSHRDRANKTQEQLTKAIEIIKELLDTQSQLDPYRDIFKDRILRAEQFLKENE